MKRPSTTAGRVCAYDRAGYAWSEREPGAHTAGRAAEELHGLLLAAGERPPFVLVGHSYGGFVVRLFADRWPQDTAGLVLLDVTNESVALDGVARGAARAQLGMAGFVARVGVIRLVGGAAVDEAAPASARDNAPVVYGAGTYAAALAELRAYDETLRQVRPTVVAGRLDQRPVVVVSAASTEPADREHHKVLAALSGRGEWMLAENTGHVIQYDRRDLVVALIDRVRRLR